MKDIFENALDLLLDSFGREAELYTQGTQTSVSVRISPLFSAKCSHAESSLPLLKRAGNVLVRNKTGLAAVTPVTCKLKIGNDIYRIGSVSNIYGPGNSLLAYELELIR